jgi:hypothetical protein
MQKGIADGTMRNNTVSVIGTMISKSTSQRYIHPMAIIRNSTVVELMNHIDGTCDALYIKSPRDDDARHTRVVLVCVGVCVYEL